MPLARIPIDELRSLCRQRIESLELWLRRLVCDCLASRFGTDYFDGRHNGNPIVRSEVRRRAVSRMQEAPGRYSTPLDTLQLGELVDILCKEDLFTTFFRGALRRAFPDGRAEARTFFDRLIDIRNRLAHANPISEHLALRVFCYTEDVISSIQEHYVEEGTGNDFNAPHFVTFRDSVGNVRSINGTREHLDLTSTRLRAGDEVRFEIDTDDMDDSSIVRWQVANISQGEEGLGRSFVLQLSPRHVNEAFTLGVSVTSHEDWHRHGNFDAHVWATYTVLPPL